MFAGLDGIDWRAMHHAYGPAEDVPALLRGLVSDDPALREASLDGMYGAVHHQGDVYDSTLASIPFLLEAVAHRALPGRDRVLELLTSIAGVDTRGVDLAFEALAGGQSGDGDEEGDEDPDGLVGTYRQANEAVAAAYPLLVRLVADLDPLVRRAAPGALLACHAQAAAVLAVLMGRLPVEADGEARAALVRAVSFLGRRAAAGRSPGVDPAAVGAWLAAVAAGPDEPALRLTALTEQARCAPASLPAEVAPAALALLDAAYAGGGPGAAPAGFSTDTLIGKLRELREREAAGRPAPEVAALVHGLSNALDDRVGDRLRLLTALLREPGWERRLDALRPARQLVEEWRGDYQELITLVGEQLVDANPRLNRAAAEVLQYLGEVAAPATEALARSLDTAPRLASHQDREGPPAWVTVWGHGPATVGPTLHALAELGDPRALPPLRWVLEHRDLPRDAGYVAGAMGAAAAGLVPLFRDHLRGLGRGNDHADRDRRDGLVAGLGRIGEPAAAAVPEIVRLLPEDAALVALGRIGRAAGDAIEPLRRLLDQADRSVAARVATALWLVEGDPAPVLPVLERVLDGGTGDAAAIAAYRGIGTVGPAGAPLASRLRPVLAGRDGPAAWTRVHAAVALARTTGAADEALPVLLAAWAENSYTRNEVAACLVELGPAARAAAPTLREELTQVRRHGARRGGGWGSDQVRSDERLLRACAAALAAMSGP